MTRIEKARAVALAVYAQRKARHRERKTAWRKLRDLTTRVLRAELRRARR